MKRIFSIISALGCVLSVSAQDYYTGRDQVSADGITFSVSVYQGLILSLSNIANTRGDAPEVYKDGSPIEPEFEEYAVANTVPGCVEKAFTETFTQEEYEMLKQDPTANIILGILFLLKVLLKRFRLLLIMHLVCYVFLLRNMLFWKKISNGM